MSAIDKVVIYGVPNPQRLKLSQVLSNKIKVTTLELYSSTGEEIDAKKDIDFQMWAYPDGIKIYDTNLNILNDSQPEFSFFKTTDVLTQQISNLQVKVPPQYIYSFVLTDYDLVRTYCTCITWNQRYFIKDDRSELTTTPSSLEPLLSSLHSSQRQLLTSSKHKYSLAMPKCKIETMINNPLILDSNTMPVFVPKVMIVCSRVACFQAQRGLLKYYHANMLKGEQATNAIRVPRIFEREFDQLVRKYGCEKAEGVFDAGDSETLRKLQIKIFKSMEFRDGYKDKCSGFLSVETGKLKEFFLSTMFAMPEQPKSWTLISDSGHPVCSLPAHDTVFHLPKFFDPISPLSLSTPIPTPSHHSHHSQSQSHTATPLFPLPIPQLIQLWKCVLLQKQILIFSNSQYKLLQLCELLLYLIQPIKWENIYIPFLPFHLYHHVEAIGGYLIGMSRIHMDYMMEKFQMKNKVVVDLEFSTILEEGGQEVIELPQSISQYLHKSLTQIQKSYTDHQKTATLSLITYLMATKPRSPTSCPLPQYLSCWLQIQKTFLHALVTLFNNFVPFIVCKDDGIISVNTEQYLSILDDPLHRAFMREIAKTMLFVRLCQYHVGESERCAWVQKDIGELFVYSHDILSHKFVVTHTHPTENQSTETGVNSKADDKVKQNMQSTDRTLNSSRAQKQKGYSWTIQDLLLPHQKYSQYIEYIFTKDLNQILKQLECSLEYLSEEQNKYRILNSQDQLQSLDILSTIELPADFGTKDKMSEKEIQSQIYHKIEVEEAARKRKKGATKDADDVYQEFHQRCRDLKVDHMLVKYLKYLQLNNPQKLMRLPAKKAKKSQNRGILSWIWEMMNPPESNRGKQQLEVKSKLQRKMTIRNIKIERALNLVTLFATGEEEAEDKKKDEHIKEPKKGKEGKEGAKDNDATKDKQEEKGQQEDLGKQGKDVKNDNLL